MVLSIHTALRFLIAICTINGLNSNPTRNRNAPLGVLSELMGKSGNKPLIVVIDTNGSSRNLGDEAPSSVSARDDSNDYHEHNKNSRHNRNNLDNNTNKKLNTLNSISRDAYEAVMYDILRTSHILLDNHQNKESNRKYTAEQCSNSKDKSSCPGSDSKQC
ncbi:uncharacterized protein LOC111358093 [Spodoptera litura]|uniref:Uncharacterized protein LOC111358093 n=1 Tax=Spodoptera litura TaxID=69820 RepID=A0A9J7IVL2_SPOLT|nr:uncharacterized protein LOC111358093 [Spodoptera litura]